MNKTKHLLLFAGLLLVGGLAYGDVEDECVDEDDQTLMLAIEESSGEKFRKLSLNGFPLPEARPQAKPETDGKPEMATIDAFNHTLSYSVTDIYIPIEGSDLSLNVRREIKPEIWALLSTDHPWYVRPNRPFGDAWRSSVCTTIELVFKSGPGEYPYAYVTDEDGETYRFLILQDFVNGTSYYPCPENKPQQESLSVSLKAHIDGTNVTYTFRKKFGTTIEFQGTDVSSPGPGVLVLFARATKIIDRGGTELTYTYANANTICPSSISCRGKSLTFSYNSSGLVESVTDPSGNIVSYSYQSGPAWLLGVTINELRTVTRADDTEINYTYNMDFEPDLKYRATDDPWFDNVYMHLGLATITDPNGQTWSFTYDFDWSRLSYMRNEGVYTGWYIVCGQPRNVTSVTFPDESVSHFDNKSKTWLGKSGSESGNLGVMGDKVLEVVDTEGGHWRYKYTNGDLIVLGAMADSIVLGGRLVPMMTLYKDLEITAPTNEKAYASFDRDSGLALKSFKDFKATTAVQYEYTDELDFEGWESEWMGFPPLFFSEIPTKFWSDPTKEIDGEGKVTEFTYDAKWRVMDSIKDPLGRFTEYQIGEDTGNRTKETVKDSPSGSVVKETDFEYGTGGFAGILLKTTVKSLSGDPSWATDLVTRREVDPTTGSVLQDIIGSPGSERITEYTYDLNNNKLSTEDPNGNVTTFTYDDMNRLTETNPPGAGDIKYFYDARGNKIREDDENGHSTLWEYDALNRVVTLTQDMDGDHVKDADDLTTTTTYNDLSSTVSVTSPNGHTTTTEYDGLQRITKITDPLSHETLLEYGTNSGGLHFGSGFKPTKVIDPRGIETTSAYDDNFRPVEVTVEYKPDSFATTATTYDDVGNVLESTDPLGHVTRFEYDALNRETRRYLAYGTTLEATVDRFYTSTGLQWKVEDELDNDTLTEYDDAGRVVKVSSPEVDDGTGTPARAVTQTVYDDANNVVETINPLGNSWTYTYDNRNRRLTETRPGTGSPTVEWEYDAVGNVIKTTDARGNEAETTYDAADRVTQVEAPSVPVYPSGTTHPTTATEYDKNGNVTKVTDANGHEINNTYDQLNRLLTTEDAEGIVVTNEYDEVGNRTAVIDGKGNRTEFEYDGLNRNTKVTDDAGEYVTYVYDAMNKIERINEDEAHYLYDYDERNRLVEETYYYVDIFAGPVYFPSLARQRTYDAVGNLLSVVMPNLTTGYFGAGKPDVFYTYDALNRIATEKSTGLTHTYKYDLAGNRIYTLYGGLSTPLISTYDEQNRLSTLTENSRVTTYTYDADGNVLTKILPNGDTVTNTYDALSRTTTMAGVTGSSAALYTYGYLYDPVGNVKKITETYGNTALNRVVTNTYDANDRLTQEAVTGSGATTTSYTYDDANNRESMTKDGVTTNYNYNNLNQLTTYTRGAKTVYYYYNADGSRNQRTDPSIAPESIGYAYNIDQRLATIYDGDIIWTLLSYDYRGRRVLLGKWHYPTYDITRDVTESTDISFSGGTSVRERETATGTSLVDYIRGSDWGGGVGGILYSLRSGTPSYTHYNRRGDVTAKTNSSGTITYQAAYEAFGQRTTETGSTLDRQKSNTKDEDHPGYVNEGQRFRDLETGTFLTRDPAGFVDGPNLYTYVKQNPWTKFDPLGLLSDDLDSEGAKAAQKAAWLTANTTVKGTTMRPEFSGLIYQRPDGKYDSTSPLPGGFDVEIDARGNKSVRATSNPSKALSQIKNGEVVVSDYHAHTTENTKSSENDTPYAIRNKRPTFIGGTDGNVNKVTPIYPLGPTQNGAPLLPNVIEERIRPAQPEGWIPETILKKTSKNPPAPNAPAPAPAADTPAPAPAADAPAPAPVADAPAPAPAEAGGGGSSSSSSESE